MAEIVPFPREPKRLQCAVTFGNYAVARIHEILVFNGYDVEAEVIRERVGKVVSLMWDQDPSMFDKRPREELDEAATQFAYEIWRNFIS